MQTSYNQNQSVPKDRNLYNSSFQPPAVSAASMTPAFRNSREDDEIEIDLVEVAYVLWQHIVQILFSFAVGAVIAFLYTYFYITPLYTATAKMYILSSSSNSVVNLSDLQISSSLRSDYQELLTSRPILEKVIESLNLDFDYRQLAGMLKVSNPKDTRILNVTVTSPSAQMSADIANQLVLQGQQDLPAIMKTEEPSIFEDALPPTRKSSPSFLKNTAIGGFLAAVLYCAILLFRHITNDTIVTPDDLYNAFGVHPLAVIPDAKKDTKNKQYKPSSHKGTRRKKESE